MRASVALLRMLQEGADSLCFPPVRDPRGLLGIAGWNDVFVLARAARSNDSDGGATLLCVGCRWAHKRDESSNKNGEHERGRANTGGHGELHAQSITLNARIS